MFFSRPRFRRFGSFWFWFGFGLGWQVALELTVVYGGGTSLVVGTDGASWKGLDATPMFNPSKSMASPAHAQPLEDMDATSAAYAAAGRGWTWRDGWANGTTAAFDDSAWAPAKAQAGFGCGLLAKPTLPLELTAGVAPAKIVALSPTRFFFDMGSEMMPSAAGASSCRPRCCAAPPPRPV